MKREINTYRLYISQETAHSTKVRDDLHSRQPLFSNFSFPGFCRLRMHNKGGAPVAFVEYQVSTDSARVFRADAVERLEKRLSMRKIKSGPEQNDIRC